MRIYEIVMPFYTLAFVHLVSMCENIDDIS